MWIQVRSMDGKKSIRMDGLSKLTKIEDLREKLVEEFEAPVERQKLFYRGKILVDGHTLYDYDVALNALIQIMVRPAAAIIQQSEKEEKCDKNEEKEETKSSGSSDETETEPLNSTYKMGDIIDCRDVTMGAWFEAKLLKITKRQPKISTETKSESEKNYKVTIQKSLENNAEELPNEKQDLVSSETEKPSEQMDTDQNENIKEESKANLQTETESKETSIEKTNLAKQSPFFGTEDDGFVYHVVYEGYEEDDVVGLPVRHVRPRARQKISLDKVQSGDKLMVNFNYDEPDSRGYWYDAIVTDKRNTRTIKELTATVYIGADLVPFENCQILYVGELFKIEEPGTQLNVNQPGGEALSPVKRANKPECDHCQDNPRRKCKFCSCSVCGDKKDPDKQVLCDECDQAYHLYCLKPALTEVPDVDEWYCPECKNDATEVVQAGEKLKESKKKARMASAKSEGKTRDWGKGMACVGRSKQCNIVPPNHFGPIPGIHVGQMWKFRVQVSEVGVHRPHVAGISGREGEGAYSLVLAGGYEDDVDNGDEFTYTGSGGRDLSGNKRTAEQSCDQTLTRMNKALARDCYAQIDNKNGAESKDWQKGKPIRVVRNCKGAKHSKYAPEEGNRYDGIYKIVKYWPDKGLSGFIVWRYMLRRDDPEAAPWTKAGKKRCAELGLTMEYPEGYLEKEEAKQREKENQKENEEATPGKGKGKGRKRKRVIESDSEEDSESPAKKKSTSYKLPTDVGKHIKTDKQNEKLWAEAKECIAEGVQKFLSKVEELFVCICCQELVFKPVTTNCNHNICKPCLQRSFKVEVYSCPACRADLGKDHNMEINKSLANALCGLYPGYESGR